MTDELPKPLPDSNYAYALHTPYKENACNIKAKHYHVIFPSDFNTSATCTNVNCIYAFFKLLVWECVGRHYKGETFEKLKKEGIPEDKIHFVGNVMIDTLLKRMEKIKKTNILQRLNRLFISMVLDKSCFFNRCGSCNWNTCYQQNYYTNYN